MDKDDGEKVVEGKKVIRETGELETKGGKVGS